MKYQSKYFCPKCNAPNNIIVKDQIAQTITECETHCSKCKYIGYWITGFYEPDEG